MKRTFPLSVPEQKALFRLWAMRRRRDLRPLVRWACQQTVAEIGVLELLQACPDLSQTPLMTPLSGARTLQQYLAQELTEYLSYCLEKRLRAQFRQSCPQQKGSWDRVDACAWRTLVETVRHYQDQLAAGEPTFAPPLPGDEAYFTFAYFIFSASEGGGILCESRLTGTDLRKWREEGKLVQHTDVPDLLAALAPLSHAEWLPEPFHSGPLTYCPVSDWDAAILAQVLLFLQTGASPSLTNAEYASQENEEREFSLGMSIQVSNGEQVYEYGDDSMLRVNRQAVLAWGQDHVVEMEHRWEHERMFVQWVGENLFHAFAPCALREQAQRVFFTYQAQTVLDEVAELLKDTFLPDRLALENGPDVQQADDSLEQTCSGCGVSPVVQNIQRCLRERWNEAHLRPLPSDDPEIQAVFFAGIADEVYKQLGEDEQQSLRNFILGLVGLADTNG